MDTNLTINSNCNKSTTANIENQVVVENNESIIPKNDLVYPTSQPVNLMFPKTKCHRVIYYVFGIAETPFVSNSISTKEYKPLKSFIFSIAQEDDHSFIDAKSSVISCPSAMWTEKLTKNSNPREKEVKVKSSLQVGIFLQGELQKDINKNSDARKVPSRFCHICLRRCDKVTMVVCYHITTGNCRKVTCKKCFEEQQWNWDSATGEKSKWVCSHCRKM